VWIAGVGGDAEAALDAGAGDEAGAAPGAGVSGDAEAVLDAGAGAEAGSAPGTVIWSVAIRVSRCSRLDWAR
jgi:hypothetical protein